MQQLQRQETKRPRRTTLPIFVRVMIAFLSCFAVALAVVVVGAKNNWFQQAYTTGDADATYRVTATDAPTPSGEPAPSPLSGYAPSPAVTDEAETGNVAVLAYSTLRLGDDNSAVITLQMRLMELGYMDYDEPSSVYNEVTQMAVMLFQRALDQETTGVADNDLQTLLYAEDAQKYQVKLSDSGSDVRSIQLRLSELGYYDDKVSGYYGPRTEEAVMLFQSYNELPVTGLFSYNTWQQLYSSSAVEAPVPATPAPTPRPTPKPTKKPTTKPTKKAEAPTAPETEAAAPATDAPPVETVTDAPPDTSVDTAAPVETPPEPTEKPKSGGSGSFAHSADGIAACAQAQMGKPYIRGDEGPDAFDCSGLVYYCMRSCGVSVRRIKSTSYASKSDWTLIESIDDIRKGDVICFKSDDSSSVNHVAISTGGSSFIHASASKGKVVRSSFSSDSSKYWNRNFVCARRPIG